jgi:hypothetical protein
MRRRRFIEGAGATGLAGLIAGCIGGQGPGDTGTESPADAGTESPADAGTEAPAGTESPTETDAGTETGTGNETETGTGTADGGSDVTGTVEDTEDDLEVTNHELYETGGEVGLQGTIQNTGDHAYGYVDVEVTLQDDQGDVLYEFIDETEEADVSRLEAGSEWQFDVVFEEAQMSEVTEYSLDVDGYLVPDADWDVTGDIDNQDENVEILTSHLTRQESRTVVLGTIKNVGEEAAENVEVNVTLYDDDDNELFDFNDTVEKEEEEQRLAPGTIWNFSVVFDDVDMQEVARYVVTANSELV